jgi:PAS domain S-box-containing protein
MSMSTPPDPEGSPAGSIESGEDTADHLLEGITSHAIFMLDTDGLIATWPDPAQELYGYDPATVLDQHISTLFADEEGAGGEIVLDDARESGVVEVEHWHERADGSVFWGTLSLSPLSDDQFHGYAAVCQDTTATKEYERMLERQNDRLKEFTDVLAHDLRNPLSAIDGHLTLYRETGAEKHIETIDETTDRMARLVDDLLRVAEQGDVVEDPEPTDIEGVVDTAWEGTGRGSGATLQYERIPLVSADSDRLCRLFENLVRNSVEHGGEEVTVRVGPLEDGFYVEDDGAGIPEDIREEVFDHGFTTDGGGSGYGLSIVRTVVNAHGWDVRVTEGDAGGARFEITGIDLLG